MPFIHIYWDGVEFRQQGARTCCLGDKRPYFEDGAPDGSFAEWDWDGQRLVVRNDRLGMFPVFYFVGPKEICVSNAISDLLANGAPRQLDEAAVAVFLRLGFYVGNDSPFRAIRALPANAILTWQNGDVHLQEARPTWRMLKLPRADAIQEFAKRFDSAVRCRLLDDEDFAVPLSGGRDSRHILYSLLRAGRPPRFCVTHRHFPNRPVDDVEVAARICAEARIEHAIVGQTGSRLEQELRKNELTSYCADEHAQTLSMVDFLRGRVGMLWDGIAGGILSGGAYQSPEGARLYRTDCRALAESLFDRFSSEAVVARTLTPGANRRLNRAVALDRLVEELDEHRAAPNPLRSFLLFNRTRREISLSPFSLMAEFRVACPYLDRRVCDLMMSLPPELVIDHRFHDDAIRSRYPEYWHLPFAGPGQASGSTAFYRRLGMQLAFYAAARIGSALVNMRYVLPRDLGCAVSGNGEHLYWRWERIVCLLQVETIIRGSQ